MSEQIPYARGPLLPNEIDFVHAMPLAVLLAAAAGKVDLNLLARQEIANRGYDTDGVWVGFKAACEAYRAQAAQDSAARGACTATARAG